MHLRILLPLLAAFTLCSFGCEAVDEPLTDADALSGDAGVSAPDLASAEDVADEPAEDIATTDAGEDGVVEEPRFPACDPEATTQLLSFVHVNDIHATYTPDSTDGSSDPVARIRGYYEQVRQENPYTLFTDGGDDHEKGSVAEPMSQGWSTERVIKAMRFDARVIGNHDFAWSEEEFLSFSRDEHALVLATNTSYAGDEPEMFGGIDFGAIEVGCLRVGFFGMVSKPWDSRNEQYEGDFFPDSDIHTAYDYEATAAAIVEAHGDEVDVMVMLSHLGLGTDRSLAENVSGIDVILGGHSHTTMPEPETVGESVIVQSGSNCAFITRLDLEVDLAGGSPLVLAHTMDLNLPFVVPDDPYVHAVVEGVMAEYAPDARDDVVWVSAACDEACVARTLADATLTLHPEVDAVAADIDLEWKTWAPGGLTPQDLLNTYKLERQPAGSPGFNAMYRVEVSGADLQRIAEAGGERWVYVGPDSIDSEATYGLGIQKRGALNPDLDDYVPVSGLSFENAEPLGEAFALLMYYGMGRAAQCLSLEADAPIEPCPPQ